MKLKARSRRLLEVLLFSGLDVVEFTTYPKNDMFRSVGWSSGRNVGDDLLRLQSKGLIASERAGSRGSWVATLTSAGREQALKGIDPELSWSEKWDGFWTSFSFDLPQYAGKERKRLNAWLARWRFGRLQGSLWVSHRSFENWTKEIESLEVDPRSILFQKACPVGKMSNAEYVAYAWPFAKIAERYLEYISFVENNSGKRSECPFHWFELERELWRIAFELDPFLPDELLPSGYLGKKAWRLRKRLYSEWAADLGEADR